MYIKGETYPTVYNVFTDANGKARLRVCDAAEASFAQVGGLVVQGDDPSIRLIGEQTGYKFQQPLELPKVKVAEG